jgi:hypothetical protein
MVYKWFNRRSQRKNFTVTTFVAGALVDADPTGGGGAAATRR